MEPVQELTNVENPIKIKPLELKDLLALRKPRRRTPAQKSSLLKQKNISNVRKAKKTKARKTKKKLRKQRKVR